MANRTFKDLTQNLINARKVMGAVENGNYKQGSIDPSALINNESRPVVEQKSNMNTKIPNNKPVVNKDKIQNSKLPDNIKKLMLENPIPQVDMTNELPPDFIDEVAKKMNEQSQYGAGGQKVNKPKNYQPQPNLPDPNYLKEMIKEAVREVMNEVEQEKLNESQKIKESLHLKVGGTLFTGVLTKAKKI